MTPETFDFPAGYSVNQRRIVSVLTLAPLKPPTKVGGWKIDRRSKFFEFTQYHYRVDFARCDNPLKACEWFWHLHEKDWGRESLGDFMEAVRSVFGNDVHPGCQS